VLEIPTDACLIPPSTAAGPWSTWVMAGARQVRRSRIEESSGSRQIGQDRSGPTRASRSGPGRPLPGDDVTLLADRSARGRLAGGREQLRFRGLRPAPVELSGAAGPSAAVQLAASCRQDMDFGRSRRSQPRARAGGPGAPPGVARRGGGLRRRCTASRGWVHGRDRLRQWAAQAVLGRQSPTRAPAHSRWHGRARMRLLRDGGIERGFAFTVKPAVALDSCSGCRSGRRAHRRRPRAHRGRLAREAGSASWSSWSLDTRTRPHRRPHRSRQRRAGRHDGLRLGVSHINAMEKAGRRLSLDPPIVAVASGTRRVCRQGGVPKAGRRPVEVRQRRWRARMGARSRRRIGGSGYQRAAASAASRS
jgi:hypothetical protein